MAVTKKIIGRIPVCFGTWYAKQGGWGIKNRVTLYGSEFESLHENNTVPPAVYDEIENTVAFNENDWRVISNGTEAWLANAKIDALGTWEENPEFVEVCLDKNGRIIYGAQRNGNFIFGTGCPQQVIDFVNNSIKRSLEGIEAFLGNVSFANKKVSIIGDSISTFVGYIPNDYPTWYPHTGDRSSDVISVNDTWWKKLIDATGSSLEINASYSGSTASNNTMGFSPRVPLIGEPDIIFIALGTNDYYRSIPIGDINFDAETYDLSKFAPAYIKGIQDTIESYPNAKIICLAFDMGAAYQNAIKTISEHYDLDYIYVGDISDVHPNKAEMQAVFERIYYTYTLEGLLNEKVDKTYLEDVYGSYEENPEFLEVKLDAERKFLWGIRKDGDIVFGCGIPSEIQNVISKTAKDIYNNFKDIRDTFHYVSNPEYLFACLDAEDRFLYGVTVEGKFRAADLEFDLPEEEAKWLNTVFSLIEDPEGRIDITLDGENKVLSWRDGEGVKHETNLAIERSLELSSEAMTAFQQALKDSGFTPGGGGDYSDTITEKGKKPVYIPTPRLARVNIIWDGNLGALSKADKGGTQKVNYDVKVPVEFFDGQGVYFKKYALMSAQGNSSFDFEKKNISLKFFDTEDVEGKKKKWGKGNTFGTVFGDWVMQKTYHLKAFHTDFIRGSSEIAYQLANEVYKTRGIYADRPWKKALIDFNEITSVTPAGLSEDGVNDMNLQIDNGARCMPDGFPVIVYQNGEFYGIYVWMLKKDADNFNMDTSEVKHIHLDGILDAVTIWGGTIDWTKFEIRNPEDLICMDDSDYDGDFPAELIDETSNFWMKKEDGITPLDPDDEDDAKIIKKQENSRDVKQYIIDLSNRVGQINTLNATDSAAAKELFDTYFDADNLIDYQLINMAVGDWDGFRKNWQWTTWDGVKWYANQYDKDCSFGNFWTGMFTTPPSRGWINNDVNVPSGLAVRYYTPEHKTRWQELVNVGIFNAEHIKSLITAWISRIGKDNFVQEWKKWPKAPCNRDSKIDFENWVYTGEHEENSDPSPSDIWNANTSYSINDKAWFPGFDPGRRRYTRFKAIKANQNKPCMTGSYSNYPMTMGYRDNVWRFYKYIEETISNQNSFINSL